MSDGGAGRLKRFWVHSPSVPHRAVDLEAGKPNAMGNFPQQAPAGEGPQTFHRNRTNFKVYVNSLSTEL